MAGTLEPRRLWWMWLSTWSAGNLAEESWSVSRAAPVRRTPAGSLYFKAPGYAQRVTVRLESGLTTRVRVEAAP